MPAELLRVRSNTLILLFHACDGWESLVWFGFRQLPLPSPPSAAHPCCPGPPPSTFHPPPRPWCMVYSSLSGRPADVPSPPPLLLLLLPALLDRGCAGMWARPSPFYTPSISLCVRVLCHALGGARAYLPATCNCCGAGWSAGGKFGQGVEGVQPQGSTGSR